MSEENLPEQYNVPAKKEKIPSKKSFMQFAREFMEINPQMSPEEVIKRTKQYMEGLNPFKTEDERKREAMASQLRKERLRRLGYNPPEWTYYGTALQPEAGWNTEFTDKDMERAHRRLPEDIELLISQGHIAPSSEIDRKRGTEFYDMDHFWDMFIRVRPQKQLDTPSVQLDHPSED